MKGIWSPLLFCAAIAFSNFFYQLCVHQNWTAACERTWFQISAVMAFWFLNRKNFKEE